MEWQIQDCLIFQFFIFVLGWIWNYYTFLTWISIDFLFKIELKIIQFWLQIIRYVYYILLIQNS